MYVVVFPHVVGAMCFTFLNRTGSIASIVVGVVLRVGGGEQGVGVPVFIKFPYFDERRQMQLFPFRTFAMLMSLAALIVVSANVETEGEDEEEEEEEEEEEKEKIAEFKMEEETHKSKAGEKIIEMEEWQEAIYCRESAL